MNQGTFEDNVIVKMPTLILKKNKLIQKETPMAKGFEILRLFYKVK